MGLISCFFIRLLTLLILIVSSFLAMQSPHYVHAGTYDLIDVIEFEFIDCRRSEPEKIKDHTKPTPSSDFSRKTTSTWLISDIHLTSLI
ncbi:unnamed protein product [Prunus armeniaca]|uniref:Uncharacterized protein n=1 Tax=Prunus armeniaca TaxID=36596 RepID=A0A6J5UXB7_PRUAR|nr:unnamed protein product [Prunus armeniaca]CAB4311748.1 unnamed protein product [Prunus armeniaca]